MPASTNIALPLDLGRRLFDTLSAAEWLTNHGVRHSPNTLRKLRCTGGGPAYWTLNGKPYYTEGDPCRLDPGAAIGADRQHFRSRRGRPPGASKMTALSGDVRT